MKLTNEKGVTLAELIVVFVIIAIGAVLLAPNIGAWLPNYRLRSATRDIASTMRTAQMKAVSTNMDYQVFFNADGSYVLQHNSNAVWAIEGTVQVTPAGIAIVTNFSPGPANVAQFNKDSTSSSGSMTLTNTKGTQKTITLTSSTGRVKIN